MSGKHNIGGLCKENIWTIEEIFEYYNISKDDTIRETGQYLGGIFILKKNPHSINYLENMIKCIEYNPLLITDYYNNNKQSVYFRDNRHEQSLGSVLRKKLGSVVIDTDESFVLPFGGTESLKYPFWATRIRN